MRRQASQAGPKSTLDAHWMPTLTAPPRGRAKFVPEVGPRFAPEVFQVHRLPMGSVRKPDTFIVRKTVSSMQSGLFYGYVAMVEGILDRLTRELETDQKLLCVATGGLASAVADETTRIDKVCDELTLIGLRCVWESNH